jgi:hypothetical protein
MAKTSNKNPKAKKRKKAEIKTEFEKQIIRDLIKEYNTYPGHSAEWFKPGAIILLNGTQKKESIGLTKIRSELLKLKGIPDPILGGEKIPGGLSSGKPDSDFEKPELAKGVKVEMEHSTDPAIAKEIAKDHLTEDKDYFDKLEIVESDILTKPTTNSLGQPIADTVEKIANFYKWFGNSKVVDSQGRPMVVYHGTISDFDRFDRQYIGRFDKGYYGLGFYFAFKPEYAEGFAKAEFGKTNMPTGSILPVYLSIKNPYLVDYSTIASDSIVDEVNRLSENESNNQDSSNDISLSVFDEDENFNEQKIHEAIPYKTPYIDLITRISSRKIVSTALVNLNYDGIIVDRMEIVVFNPNQVKSTLCNSGLFSHDNPDICDTVTEQKEIEKPEDFDWDKVFAEPTAEENEAYELKLKKEKEDEAQAEFNALRFDKKWASTRAEAIEKLKIKYNESKKIRDVWNAKTYKKHGGSVEVGNDDIHDSASVSIDYINQNRKNKAIRMAEYDMKEAIDDLKRLKAQSEIDELISGGVSAEKPEELSEWIPYLMTFDEYFQSIQVEKIRGYKNRDVAKQDYHLYQLQHLFKSEIKKDNFNSGINKKLDDINSGILQNTGKAKVESAIVEYVNGKILELYQQAQTEGKELPGIAYVDYPELKAVVKEPWQMTREEYAIWNEKQDRLKDMEQKK